LASSIEKVPTGDRWVHEIKFDGYRVQVHLANNEVKVFTRRGHDWTNRFKKIASDAWHISAGSAIIDGEVVAPAADGTTDFPFCKTNSRADRPRSSWSLSTCFTSTGTICVILDVIRGGVLSTRSA
jgi:ATP-dependent DNA ligase